MIALASPIKREFMFRVHIQSMYLINMLCDTNDGENTTECVTL